MYSTLPSFVLGFHGCDKSVRDKIISGQESLKVSENSFDWLGHGIYFWENNPSRALEYAGILKKYPKRSKSIITEEAVIGAIIDLGYCLNLLETDSIQILKQGYEILEQSFKNTKKEMPKNKPAAGSKELLLRNLDCAVIQTVHAFNKENKKRPYDSVRGMFMEGEELYPNAGFRYSNHIQICVCNPNCIKGYFIPREAEDEYPIP